MLIDYQKVNIYQEDVCVLKDVNFQVNEGEFIFIIGKVGSGKSTLLKSLYCEIDIEKDDADKADVLGRDLLSIKRSHIPALRKEMGIIFQDFQLLHDRTVEKNFRFVLKATGWKDKDEINERIDEVLTLVDMADKKDKMPHELSGGEQQRVAIARAILNHPTIIIADEPTGNLDPETAGNIIAILKRISEKGTAVVMSTHNISIISRVKATVYRCKDGRIGNVTAEFHDIDLSQELEFIEDDEEITTVDEMTTSTEDTEEVINEQV